MKKAMLLLSAILAMILASCGYSETHIADARTQGYDSGYEEGYNAGYEAGYDAGITAPKPIVKPYSGTILSGKEYSGSQLTITTDEKYSYVVSLKDSNGKEYMSFFVRAGHTITVGVPSEKLYVYFASGEYWYGYGKGLMFGEETVYTKDNELRDFTKYTIEYTLSLVEGGNFSESPSSEDEFF